MEDKIRYLFEYQRFSPNERLEELVAETERKFLPLSDDMLDMVAAAGEPGRVEEKLQERLFEPIE